MTLERCPWFVAGPLLGLLMVGLRAMLNKPFGALGGFIDVAANVASPRGLGFRAYLLAGLVLGGFVFATTSGSFSPSLAYAEWPVFRDIPFHVGLLILAGLVMGFGARTAGGCTSGHGMSGMSLASPASMAAGMTFFGVAVGLAHLLAALGGAP